MYLKEKHYQIVFDRQRVEVFRGGEIKNPYQFYSMEDLRQNHPNCNPYYTEKEAFVQGNDIVFNIKATSKEEAEVKLKEKLKNLKIVDLEILKPKLT